MSSIEQATESNEARVYYDVKEFQYSLPEALKQFQKEIVVDTTFGDEAELPYYKLIAKMNSDYDDVGAVVGLAEGRFDLAEYVGLSNEDAKPNGNDSQPSVKDILAQAMLEEYPDCRHAVKRDVAFYFSLVIPPVYPGGDVFNMFSKSYDDSMKAKGKVQAAIDILGNHFQALVVTMAQEGNVSDDLSTKMARTSVMLEYFSELLAVVDQGIVDVKHHFAQIVALVFTPPDERGNGVFSFDLEVMRKSISFTFAIPTQYDSMFEFYEEHRYGRDPVEDEKELREAQQEMDRHNQEVMREIQFIQFLDQLGILEIVDAEEDTASDNDGDD